LIANGNFHACILAHSVNPVGDEAITFELCYERIIHAELNKHRWSRNSSSSRAIPVKFMVDWTVDHPAMPLHYGGRKKGMSSGKEITGAGDARKAILDHLQDACHLAKYLDDLGLHKEFINRYLEPWGWINDVITMGRRQLMNFFKLRIAPGVQPNMQRLAVTMAKLYRTNIPRPLAEGEWHLPYISAEEHSRSADFPIEHLTWSSARCAWVSYKTVDGKVATWEDAKRRHDSLVADGHCTPLEHQLRARGDSGQSGCVPGYDSYRSMIPGETADDFDFSVLDTVYADKDFTI
jgi:hypothetical protein